MHLIISGAGPRGTTEVKSTAAVIAAFAPQLRALKKHEFCRNLRLDITLVDKQSRDDRTCGNAFKGAVTLNGAVAKEIRIPNLVDSTWPSTALSPPEALREAINDPEKHAMDLLCDSVPAAALVRHATVNGIVDTTRACTTRAMRGEVGKRQLDDVLRFIGPNISDLMSIRFKYEVETIAVDVATPSITYIQDGEIIEEICDEVNLAHGTTNKQSICAAKNVFDQTIDTQNLLVFYKANKLWTNGALGEDLDVLVHGTGLYGADYVGKLLTDAKHIILADDAPGGVAVNPESRFKGMITMQSREGYVPPVRMEIPSAITLFPRHYGSTIGLWAATLDRDGSVPTEAREILHANIAHALGWHPDEVAQRWDPAERIRLYYRGMIAVHKRPHDARSYFNLGTLLHEGYKRLWNGQGFEDNSATILARLEEHFPIICGARGGWNFQDAILHNVTSEQWVRNHGSNKAAMEASAEAQVCLAAATPPVFAALAIGVNTGVIRHLSKPFADDDNIGRDMVCSAMMLTKDADIVNAGIKGVSQIAAGQPEYTTGRHLVRDGQASAVRESGYGGHGISQISSNGTANQLGVRWLSTNSEDAGAQLAHTNAYINVTKAVLQSVGVPAPMKCIRQKYLANYSGTDVDFEREQKELAPYAISWLKDYAFLTMIRKLTRGNPSQYRKCFELGVDINERDRLISNLGGVLALKEYRALSTRGFGANSRAPRPLSRTEYVDRYTDIPPKISEQILQDTLQSISGYLTLAADSTISVDPVLDATQLHQHASVSELRTAL